MKIKKAYLGIILSIIFILILNISTTVNAAWKWSQIKEEYNKNNSIVSTLSDSEIAEWRKELNAIANSTALEEVPPEQIGQGVYFSRADINLATVILEAIKDVEAEKNSNSNQQNGTGQTDDELKKYNHTQIRQWLETYDVKYLSKEVQQTWRNTVNTDTKSSQTARNYTLNLLNGMSREDAKKQSNEETFGSSEDKPSTGVLGQSTSGSKHTVDEIINEAQGFINKGNSQGSKIDQEALQGASNTLYNLLLVLGIVLAVIIGTYLGVKFMISSAEDKAKVKESLIPYISGCVVMFGAFIIWKLVVLLLGGIA